MAPTSLNSLLSSLSPFGHGVFIILAVFISILVLIIALMALGLGQRVVGWVIDQWQHLGLRQHLTSPRLPRESMQLPIQTPPPTPPLVPHPTPPIPIPAPTLSLRSVNSFDTFGVPVRAAPSRYRR